MDTQAALSPEACDVCSGRETLDRAFFTCSPHFLEWLDSDGPPQRSVVHRQYEDRPADAETALD